MFNSKSDITTLSQGGRNIMKTDPPGSKTLLDEIRLH